MRAVAFLMLWCMAACGCVAPLPTYPAMDDQAALNVTYADSKVGPLVDDRENVTDAGTTGPGSTGGGSNRRVVEWLDPLSDATIVTLRGLATGNVWIVNAADRDPLNTTICD